MNFCIDTLKLRAGCDKVNDSNDLCEKHYNDFIHFFTIRYNKCCDPFEIHCNKVTKKRKKVNKGKSLKVTEFAKIVIQKQTNLSRILTYHLRVNQI